MKQSRTGYGSESSLKTVKAGAPDYRAQPHCLDTIILTLKRRHEAQTILHSRNAIIHTCSGTVCQKECRPRGPRAAREYRLKLVPQRCSSHPLRQLRHHHQPRHKDRFVVPEGGFKALLRPEDGSGPVTCDGRGNGPMITPGGLV